MAGPQSRKKLTCRIIKISDDPYHKGRKIVAMRIDDGSSEGEYTRGVSIIPPPHPISIEQFAEQLSDKDLDRPRDPFEYLKEAMDNDQEFDVIQIK